MNKINLCIAKRCFLTCRGCYNNFCSKKEITYNQVIPFLTYAKKNGLKRVTLSGGDPLSRKDIAQIIQKCLDLDLKINLDTVGIPFVKEEKLAGTNQIIPRFDNVSLLQKIDMIGIPLDGSKNDIIAKFRCYNGNLLDITLQILDFFEKNNIKIGINTVLHKGNLDDIENIFKTIKKYNCIQKWQVFQFMAIGPLGKKNEDLFKITKEEFKAAKDKIMAYPKSHIKINFKDAKEREHNYMLVNSNGAAYKVNLSNNVEFFGNITDSKTWDNILKNLS